MACSLISCFSLGVSVRRLKKAQAPSKSSSSSTNENVEIITRPDGKKVRRIRKTKPNPSDKTNQLSGFLDSQPKSTPRGGGATVTGATSSKLENKKKVEGSPKDAPKAKKDRGLGSFFGSMNSGPAGPPKMGSASVAGDQVAITKEASLTGEVYIRADGKKGKNFIFVPYLLFKLKKRDVLTSAVDSPTCKETYTGSTRRPS